MCIQCRLNRRSSSIKILHDHCIITYFNCNIFAAPTDKDFEVRESICCTVIFHDSSQSVLSKQTTLQALTWHNISPQLTASLQLPTETVKTA